jgi:hypothetical protein
MSKCLIKYFIHFVVSLLGSCSYLEGAESSLLHARSIVGPYFFHILSCMIAGRV